MKRIDYSLFSAKVRIISEYANLLPKIFKKNCRKSTEDSTKKPHYSHEQRGIQILKNTFASEQNDVCSSAKVRIFSFSASIFTIFFVFCVHFFVLKKNCIQNCMRVRILRKSLYKPPARHFVCSMDKLHMSVTQV